MFADKHVCFIKWLDRNDNFLKQDKSFKSVFSLFAGVGIVCQTYMKNLIQQAFLQLVFGIAVIYKKSN